MNDDLKRKLVYGLISLALSLLATRLALYLTDKILGKQEGEQLLDEGSQPSIRSGLADGDGGRRTNDGRPPSVVFRLTRNARAIRYI